MTGLCQHPQWHSPRGYGEAGRANGEEKDVGVIPLLLGREVGTAGAPVGTNTEVCSLSAPRPQNSSDNHYQLLPREASRERGGPAEGPEGEPRLHQSRRAQRYVQATRQQALGPHTAGLCSLSFSQQTIYGCAPG